MARIVPKLNLNKTPELVDNNSLIFAKNIRFNANGLSSDFGFDNVLTSNEDIVGIIPYNTSFYVFKANNTIWHYDELTNTFEECNCNWHWSGGKIDGVCTISLNGDILLTVAEYDANVDVPIKTINLTEAKRDDDETIYTQSPRVSFINLDCVSTYKNVIPAGTYQFFIRYEIRKDFYTNWFPASKELFAGTKKSMRTQQGGLTFVDTKSDSNFSFKFAVHNLINTGTFKKFQLGFIIAHDDEVYARAYKHYDINTETIYFDYDTEAIEEIDIKDLLESPYSLYNVKNVTSFKNKLYISNYKESDFNPDFRAYASSIQVSFDEIQMERSVKLSGRPVTVVTNSQIDYITNIGITSLDDISGETSMSIKNLVELLLNNNKAVIINDEAIPYTTDSKLNFNLRLNKWIGGIDVDGAGINPIIVSSGLYTLTYGNSQEVTSENIDVILSAIVNAAYAVNMNTGKLVDSSYNGPLDFTIVYYTPRVDDPVFEYTKTTINISFAINVADIEKDNVIRNEYTLVPHQGYNFYLHLVKNNGEITNGYLINEEPLIVDEPSAMLSDNEFPAIYPIFTFTEDLPAGYVSCIISIAHVKNTVAHIFDIETQNSVSLGHCLELDANLYPWLKDIIFVKDDSEAVFDYRASYDNENLTTFGGVGECVFQSALQDTSYGFAKMPYEANEEYTTLIQCTPYIIAEQGTVYDEYRSLNLPGYLCRVQKPRRDIARTYYFSGSDIYLKSIVQNASGESIGLEVAPDENTIWSTQSTSTEYTIYSNFNLNYLALTEDLAPVIVTKTLKDENNTEKSYILRVKQSSQLSEVYELPSMYKSYTRKLYSIYSYYNIIVKFDNTIRSSKLEGDETKINMFKFAPTDYYNVPTDKGIIINLVAVGDNILVHTQDSIYKFSGQNSLTAAGGEDVQMKESEPFDTGIQELFGSEFGYAGLASKEHQILSEFGYTFWDRDSGRIYLYTGNAQMKVLSDDISKLLRRTGIKDIHLADDYYNNRIFICIEFTDNKIATLSYDFIAKSFISLHDFKFNWHFKTKTKCYFISNEHDIHKVGTEPGTYEDLRLDDTLYPIHTSNGSKHGNCIIDVIFNDRFENIKTLNTIQWICNEVLGFDSTINMAEENFRNNDTNPEERYKGDIIRIYTDSCMTDEISLTGRSNDSINDYEKVRYNLGKWTFNYFRNILHRSNNQIGTRPFRQDDTLIYGKYIVARFIFNRTTDFKFEDVTFITSNDYNV